MRPAAQAQIDPPPAPSPAALAKSRLKRLFERQVLRVSPAERLPPVSAGGDKDDLEPSSVCLDGMVRSFLEDGGGGVAERAAAARCCNCFNGGDASDDDDDGPAAAEASAISDAAETIKVLCAERFFLLN